MIINVPNRWVEPMAITRKYGVEATTRGDGAGGCNIEYEGSHSLTEILAAADEYDAREVIVAEIHRLEALETPRRLAEAVLSDEGKAWLTANRDKVATERGKL